MYMYTCACVYVCVHFNSSLFLPMCVCVCVHISVPLSFSLYLYACGVCVCACACVSLCLCVFVESVRQSVSPSLCILISLFLHRPKRLPFNLFYKRNCFKYISFQEVKFSRERNLRHVCLLEKHFD